MDQLVINGNSRAEAEETAAVPSFAPGAPPPPTSFAAPPPSVEESNYILIRTAGPLSAADNQALAQAEVDILEYKGNNIYLCGYKPKALEPIVQGLSNFVHHAEVYHPAYVVQSRLKTGDQSQETTVNLSLHPDVVSSGDQDTVANAQSEIASALGVPVTDIQISHGTAQVTVPKSRLDALAVIDAVQNIQEYVEPTLNNHSAGVIMKVHKPVGVCNTTYKGNGQTVCVGDTGFDTGNKDKCHPAFGDRVLALYPFGRPDTGRTDDFDGHGTHVSGSVIGNGTYTSAANDGEEATPLKVESPASEAKLIVQAVASRWVPQLVQQFPNNPEKWRASLSGIPPSLIALFTPIVNNHPDCAIHTNSWGSKPDGFPAEYESSTRDIDQFSWQRQSMSILYSAGNSGYNGEPTPVAYSVTSQGQAKNCISVGATESIQPTLRFPSGELNTFNNPESLAYFSSRGPANKNAKRIKPDIVAPGMTILSTRSSKIDPPAHYTPGWGISDDETWQFNSGTSMACPLVASCVAVLRGALVDNGGVSEPSSALIKALLINGAVALQGTRHDVPNFDSGFGRVNLENSLANAVNPGSLAGFGDKKDVETEALAKNGRNPESFSFEIPVPAEEFNGEMTLKITMAYTDRPGQQLQSDLNLIVAKLGEEGEEGEEGEKRFGNLGEGVTGRDDVNNVEQVVWDNVTPGGTYRVTVDAYNIPGIGVVQPFAYAWRLFSTPLDS
ncbi:subtilisin-like protease [Rhypophila decipiens]